MTGSSHPLTTAATAYALNQAALTLVLHAPVWPPGNTKHMVARSCLRYCPPRRGQALVYSCALHADCCCGGKACGREGRKRPGKSRRDMSPGLPVEGAEGEGADRCRSICLAFS